MPIKILVIDDFAPFRTYLHSVLESKAEFQVVGQASDGLEAVQKTVELRPDLVLLDIGLPKLNGLEVAGQLRQLVPSAKILFLTQEFSFEIVEAAFRSGALGYIHKLRANAELLPGIEAVLQGKYFVSGVVRDELGKNHRSRIRHEIQLYSDDSVCMQSFADFIAAALEGGKAAIVVATEPHLAGVFQRLTARKLDVDHAIRTGVLTAVDAVQALSLVMRDEMPDPNRFFDVLGGLIETAGKAATRDETPRVAVCGECAPLLLAQGKVVPALRLEQLWSLVACGSAIDILCAYPLASVEQHNSMFQTICSEHSVVHSR